MQGKIIDLTHILNEDITVYPDTEAPEFIALNTVGIHGYAELKMSMVSHTGTHIDAPCHVLQNKRSLDQFPPDQFIGPAIVIPCLDQHEIDVPFLQTFEEQIARVDFILFFTGWQYKWKTEDYFDDCPTLTREAARWLTRFRLKGIGVDSFSLDRIIPAEKVTPDNLPNHYILLEKEILLIENLTNLDKIPSVIFRFQCFPLHVEHADGSPVRAIAEVDG